MGQTIIDEKTIARIDKAYDMLRKQIEEHNERLNQFKEEFWTKNIQDMFKIVKESCSKYVTALTEDGKIVFDLSAFSIGDDHCWMTDCIGSNNHDKETVNNISYYASKLERSKKVLELFMEYAEEIIETIALSYQEIVESQNDKLDKVFEILGVDEPKTKHIKVTVEWV